MAANLGKILGYLENVLPSSDHNIQKRRKMLIFIIFKLKIIKSHIKFEFEDYRNKRI